MISKYHFLEIDVKFFIDLYTQEDCINRRYQIKITFKNSDYLIVGSPQELIKKSTLGEQSPPFYINAPGTTYSFGVPLWAYAYEKCLGVWEYSSQESVTNFSFVLDVGKYPGFVFSGLRLGIKLFLFQGDDQIFKKLQAIVREKRGDIWRGE